MKGRANTRWTLLVSLLVSVSALAAVIGPIDSAAACDAESQHSFGVSAGCFDLQLSGAPSATNAAPDFTQAGGHPYELTTTIRPNAPGEEDPVYGQHWPPEPLKDLQFNLPSGLVANPSAVDFCTRAEFAESSGEGAPDCPPSSQIGLVIMELSLFGGGVSELGSIPLYMLEPSPDAIANVGFNFLGLTSVLNIRLDPSADGRLSIENNDIGQALSIVGLLIKLWGTPADPAHTPQRSCPGQPPPFEGSGCAAGVAPRPFLSMPSSCNGPTMATARYDSWTHPGVFGTASVATHLSPGLRGDPTAGSYPGPYPGLDAAQWGPPQGPTGCDQLPFEPSISVETTTRSAGAPTGLSFHLEMPHADELDPAAVAESDLKDLALDLPRGLAINPAVANGLTGCTPAQIGLESSDLSTCPPSSKLGLAVVNSPLLDQPLSGSIYVAADGGGGATLPIYLVVEGSGVRLKLAGGVSRDGTAGRLRTTLDDLPQLPFSGIDLSFFGGQRAPFVNPPECGNHTANGHLVPWSGGQTAELEATLDVTSGPEGGACGAAGTRPFAPSFTAGSTDPLAGAASSFVLRLKRKSSEQELNGLDVTLPRGLAASVRDVPLCPESALGDAASKSGAAELASPSCPSSSQVGSITAAAGAGSEPLMIGGKLFLAGPYEGAPFSLAALVPIVAGPLDLGTSLLRFSLGVDPSSGRIEIGSALPTTQEGMDLQLQSIAVTLDRPGFIRNPTSCAPATIAGQAGGTDGAVASLASRFQVRDCSSLPFSPKVKMRFLGGRAATNHGAHAGVRAVIESGAKAAGIRRATVTLPGSQQMDLSHVGQVCQSQEPAASACPASSSYGSVQVSSPLLAGLLRGKIYLVASHHRFPDVVAAVHGDLDLRLGGRLTFEQGLVHVVFDSLPDLQISRIGLSFEGGRRGIFVNNRDLCTRPSLAQVALSAYNGKAVTRRGMVVGVACNHR